MENSRKEYLDILRALAAIGVIVIHVSANNWYGNIGTFNWMVFTIYEGVFKISVPVISIMILILSYTSSLIIGKIPKTGKYLA